MPETFSPAAMPSPPKPIDISSGLRDSITRLETLVARTGNMVDRIDGPLPEAPSIGGPQNISCIRDMAQRIESLFLKLERNVETLDSSI